MKALPNQATKSKKPTLLPKVPKVSFRVPLSNITNVQRTATNLEQKKTTTRPTSKVLNEDCSQFFFSNFFFTLLFSQGSNSFKARFFNNIGYF
jgi:hypothetical protein